MANEYIQLKQNEELGIIAITKHAFELITTYSVEEDEDASLINTKFTKAVGVRISNNKLFISVNVNIKYGKNVNRVVDRLQERIAKTIKDMTDYQSTNVDINVAGFTF